MNKKIHLAVVIFCVLAMFVAPLYAQPKGNPPGPKGGPGKGNPPGPIGGPGAGPRTDRDNNPPGPKGGPGTNWENPPGPKGGPGVSPDQKPKFDKDNNPPGPKGGPGTDWKNPPGTEPLVSSGASSENLPAEAVVDKQWEKLADTNQDGIVDQVEIEQWKKAHLDRDNNPPGPKGGPGTNWENPSGKPLLPPPPKKDRDNNPPGPKGGPGTNWENPPGPKGGPGVGPNKGNPPGPKGGPGRGSRR